MAIQDFKSYGIWWFLPIVFGASGMYLHYLNSPEGVLLVVIGSNLFLLLTLVLILYISSRFLFKTKFLQTSFGLGDVAFIVAMAFSFSVFPFLVFLVFSLLFAITLTLIKSGKNKLIPLVGYMSVFLLGAYPTAWWYSEKILYL